MPRGTAKDFKKKKKNSNLVFSLLGDVGGGRILNPFTKSQSTEKKNQSLDMGDAPRAKPLKPPISGQAELKPMHTASTHSVHSFTHLSEAFYEGGFVLGTGGEIKINQTWKQPSKSNSHPSGERIKIVGPTL